jgi:hypothetical protein
MRSNSVAFAFDQGLFGDLAQDSAETVLAEVGKFATDSDYCGA